MYIIFNNNTHIFIHIFVELMLVGYCVILLLCITSNDSEQ